MPDQEPTQHRIAIVGAGLIAEGVHLPRLTKRSDAEVAVIIDRDRSRAEHLAAKFGVADAQSDFEVVLADASIDVVDLCTPPTFHAEQLSAAIAAGKRVILEKPVATTLKEAERLAQAAAGYDRTVMIAENWVYSSSARWLLRIIREGRVGDVYLWTSRHESDHRLASGGQPDWNYRLGQSGGGYLMQAGTHPVTLARHLFGEIDSVMAVSPQAAGDGSPFLDDDMAVLLQFRSGVTGNLILTSRSRRTSDRVLSQSVFGTEGVAEVDILTGAVRLWPQSSPAEAQLSMGYDEEFDHFFECVRSGREPLTSITDQVETIRTITAIYQAAALGTRVELRAVS